jgi:ArsR family transcriptional regulator, arsenate/arsenite/antimonite-responsive transcriptional repressor
MELRLAELFRGAAEPARLRILNLLRHGSICVCHLQAVLNLPQPTVSRHLAALRHAGLALDFREGPRVVYSLAPATTPQMKTFFKLLDELCSKEPALERDGEALKEALRDGRCIVLERRGSFAGREKKSGEA